MVLWDLAGELFPLWFQDPAGPGQLRCEGGGFRVRTADLQMCGGQTSHYFRKLFASRLEKGTVRPGADVAILFSDI